MALKIYNKISILLYFCSLLLSFNRLIPAHEKSPTNHVNIIKYFNADQISALSDYQIKNLTELEISEMNENQIKALTKTQIPLLNDSQIKALPDKYINSLKIEALNEKQIPALKSNQINNLSKTQIYNLKPEQIKALIKEQIEVLTQEQIEALDSEQIRTLYKKDTLKFLLKNSLCFDQIKLIKHRSQRTCSIALCSTILSLIHHKNNMLFPIPKSILPYFSKISWIVSASAFLIFGYQLKKNNDLEKQFIKKSI